MKYNQYHNIIQYMNTSKNINRKNVQDLEHVHDSEAFYLKIHTCMV